MVIDSCQCSAAKYIYFWSIKKEKFLPRANAKLPLEFGFYSGCAIAMDRERAVLIGGHYVKPTDSGNSFNEQELFIQFPSNDKVAMLNISNGQWSNLPNVPLPIIGKKDQSDFHYVCGTSFNKNGTRLSIRD